MSKPTNLTQAQWSRLYQKLKEDYPITTLLIRTRMREHLGFVNRDYRYYDAKTNRYHELVCLDWYSEPKRTMFLLKYGDYLTNTNTGIQHVTV